MNTTWDRLASATGVAYFVFTVATIFIFDWNSVPQPGTSAKDIAAFYTNNVERMRSANFVLVIGIGFLIWFMGSVRSRLAVAEGPAGRLAPLAFAGGTLTALLYLVATYLPNGFPDDLQKLDDTAIVAYHAGVQALHNPLIGASTVTRAILLGAVGLASIRVGAMPKWFGWLTLALAAVSAAGIIAAGVWGWGPVPRIIWYLAFILFPVWILVASIILTWTTLTAPKSPALEEV